MSLDINKDQVWYDTGGKANHVSIMYEYHVRNALRLVIKFFNKKDIEDIHKYIDSGFSYEL